MTLILELSHMIHEFSAVSHRFFKCLLPCVWDLYLLIGWARIKLPTGINSKATEDYSKRR